MVATYDSTSGPHWYGVVMPDVAVDAMGRANVVYARIYDTLGPGYRRQSGDTWTQPTYPNGTAAIVSPVGQMFYKGTDHIINEGKIGSLTERLYNEILQIQYGEKEDPFGWRIRIH